MLKVQKAKHLYLEMENAKPKCTGHTYHMFEKYDGWYGYCDLNPGFESPIRSRTGRVIPSMREFSDELSLRLPETYGRLIFEIMIPNMDFAELNGILNRKYTQAKSAYIVVHDFIPYQGNPNFEYRFGLVKDIVEECNHSNIKLARLLGVSCTYESWIEACRSVWSTHGEGLILKRSDAKYGMAVRNYDLMKIKEEITLDLVVVGVEEGLGKYEGTLGSLLVQDKVGVVHSISGMDDLARNLWWHDNDLIVGKIVEVRAMKILPDGKLREPRFKAVRHDKTVDEID